MYLALRDSNFAVSLAFSSCQNTEKIIKYNIQHFTACIKILIQMKLFDSQLLRKENQK